MISDEPPIELNKELLQGFKIQKVFKDFLKEINHFDFTADGRFLVACDDQTINVYDLLSVKKIRTLYNIGMSIDLVKFSGDQSHILCVTKNEPYLIIHWALQENQILKRFTGHSQSIYHLDFYKQVILTCSLDGTLRLWDIKSKYTTCQALLDFNDKNPNFAAALDPSCQVFAVAFTESSCGVTNNQIYLYRLSKFQEGAFQSKKVPFSAVKFIKFSPNNKYLLCVCVDGMICVIDAFLLTNLCEIQPNPERLDVSFTPNSQFLLSSTQSGAIYIHSLDTKLIVKLEGHLRRCNIVKFSPQLSLMVSCCRNLVVWSPNQIIL